MNAYLIFLFLLRDEEVVVMDEPLGDASRRYSFRLGIFSINEFQEIRKRLTLLTKVSTKWGGGASCPL